MTHAEYVYPAYAVAAIAVLGLVTHAYMSMRRAERAAAAERRREDAR